MAVRTAFQKAILPLRPVAMRLVRTSFARVYLPATLLLEATTRLGLKGNVGPIGFEFRTPPSQALKRVVGENVELVRGAVNKVRDAPSLTRRRRTVSRVRRLGD